MYNTSVFSRKLPKYLDLSGNQNAGKLSIDSVQHRNKSSLASIKLSRQSSRVLKLRTSVVAVHTGGKSLPEVARPKLNFQGNSYMSIKSKAKIYRNTRNIMPL